MCCDSDLHLEIVVPNQTRYLSLVGNIAEQVVRVLDVYVGDREDLAYQLNLVLTEAMANAIRHAGTSNNHGTVRVCIYIQNQNLLVRVYDQGQGFDLEAVPAPDLDELSEGGRGLFLIRTLMDTVAYQRTEHGNVLEMQKKLA
jgi:serine/threonine-protein kinase RsbW